jgi:uncharacterized membrane protein
MNTAHWHLVLNHIPILGVWFILAWMVAALILGNSTMLRSSWVAFVVLAALTIPTYLTGEPSEEIIEHQANVSHKAIGRHENAAKIGLIGGEALGVLSLAALLLTRRRENLTRPLTIATVVLALICGVWMGYVGNLGGQVSHPEVRDDVGGIGKSTPSREDNRRDKD